MEIFISQINYFKIGVQFKMCNFKFNLMDSTFLGLSISQFLKYIFEKKHVKYESLN